MHSIADRNYRILVGTAIRFSLSNWFRLSRRGKMVLEKPSSALPPEGYIIRHFRLRPG